MAKNDNTLNLRVWNCLVGGLHGPHRIENLGNSKGTRPQNDVTNSIRQ